MIKNYKNFALGVFIFIIPFLGLPLSFKFFLVSFCGFLLSLFSVSFSNKENLDKVTDFYENVTDSFKDFSAINQIKEVVKKPRKPRVKKVDTNTDIQNTTSQNSSVLDENNENFNNL